MKGKMMLSEIDYRTEDWQNAVKLREKVLRAPLGSSFTAQELEDEKEHIQIAGFVEDLLMATAVLVPESNSVKMQRVAVLEAHRNLGYGSDLLKFCETVTMELRKERLYCHARDTAVRFYEMNGYQREGDYFDEDGIPHLIMFKVLMS